MRLANLFGHPLATEQVLPALDAHGVVLVSEADRTAVTDRLSSLWQVHPHPHAGRDGWTVIAPLPAPPSTPNSAGFTRSALTPHTDRSQSAHPPALLCFLVESGPASGGESVLIDAKRICGTVAPAQLDVVQRALWLDDPTTGFRQPLLSLDNGLLIVRYRNDRVAAPQSSSPGAAALLAEFERAQDPILRRTLRPGEGYLIHNHRILHGRTGFDGSRTGARCLGSVDERSPYAFLNRGFRIHDIEPRDRR
jgi:Taurine catabolism dioxygenase TauD, TfdA family